MLEHPFYQRWYAGRLERGELAEYASTTGRSRPPFPRCSARCVERLQAEGRTEAAALVARNLADELGEPGPHLALFDRFAESLCATTLRRPSRVRRPSRWSTPTEQLAEESPVAALAGLAAYELQARAIAASKADGLRLLYGIDGRGTAFWDVHADMDADHGEWAVDAPRPAWAPIRERSR